MSGSGGGGVLPVRGIAYDTGVDYVIGGAASAWSRDFWHPQAVERDMAAIAGDLHCTAVTVLGTDHTRLHEAAEAALARGLDVWLQPRLIEGTRRDTLRHLAEAARIAEDLRRGHEGRVTLNVGCELSLFMRGILPGRNFLWRMRGLMAYWTVMPLFDRRLNAYLGDACTVARERFHGPLTYSSGEWEGVDWAPFDHVGVDYYRDRWNTRGYVDGLRRYAAHGKPLVITEFGCCSFAGAERKGGGGFLVVDWRADPPVVKPGHRRDEGVQADYIEGLVDLYREEGVHGAFVYAFSEPRNLHTDDPRSDLDMASYGVVAITHRETADAPEQWRPKPAFDRLAAAYAR
jgi:hypothetical protein